MFAITPKWANCSDLGIICNPSRKWKSVIADALPIKSEYALPSSSTRLPEDD